MSVRSYYWRLLRRAVSDTKWAIASHVLFALAVALASLGVGVVAGRAVNAETLTSYVLYPLAALGVVALFTLATMLALAPVREARDAEVRRELAPTSTASLADRLSVLVDEGGEIMRKLRDGSRSIVGSVTMFCNWEERVALPLAELPSHLHELFENRRLTYPQLIGADPIPESDRGRLADQLKGVVDAVGTATAIQRVWETKATGREAAMLLVQDEMIRLLRDARALRSRTFDYGENPAQLGHEIDAWEGRAAWLARNAFPSPMAEWEPAPIPGQPPDNPPLVVPAEKVSLLLARESWLGEQEAALRAGDWSILPGFTGEELWP